MNALKPELAELETVKDLKQLLSSEPPCLSIYLPLTHENSSSQQGLNANVLRWKELMNSLQSAAEKRGSQAQELLTTVADFESLSEGLQLAGKSVGVFRSSDRFRIFMLQESVPDKAEFGQHFNVRPLLPELTRGKRFYLLALSQKDVRLLQCTLTASAEVSFTQAVDTSFDGFMDSAKPDHTSPHGAASGSGSGGVRTVTGTTNTERETKEQYLHHFFKQIDRAVNETLRGHTEPLITAGVDYELALYRTVNTYPHLLEEAVHGAPNGLKAGEMHARALQALSEDYDTRLDAVLADYDHKVGSGASNRLMDVITAAHDGRVLNLVVSDSLITEGSFDQATNSAKGQRSDGAEAEDLVNDAAVQTILHAGNVWVASNKKMPQGAPVAAIYRY